MSQRIPPPAGQHLPLIDAVKAIASQLIILHHLAFYGPMSDYARPLAPELMDWLSQHARIAVQLFLVMGGFLAAQSLARNGRPGKRPFGQIVWQRYLKLATPYVFTLVLTIAAAAVSRSLITHDSIPDAPSFLQFFAHVFLLHGVLGFDGLSAGVWYVAIDFQLYVLLLVVLRLTLRNDQQPRTAYFATIALIILSLYVFNRNPAWDNWAVYFFGAYGLGAMAYWGTQRNRVSGWFITTLALAAIALLIDFRLRILVALLAAITLGAARVTGLLEIWPRSRLLAWLAKISYSVFLVHFPICLVVNAFFERFVPHSPALQAGGMLLAWTTSIACGAAVYNRLEQRAGNWIRQPGRTIAAATP